MAAAGSDAPVFTSGRGGGQLDQTAVLRLIRKAARRAGLEVNVSPHWLRHSHATHALECSAPVHLVTATLGHSSIQTSGRQIVPVATWQSDELSRALPRIDGRPVQYEGTLARLGPSRHTIFCSLTAVQARVTI